MAENGSNKTSIFILRIGEALIPPVFLFAAFMSWDTYNIWGKLTMIGVGGFLILGGALYELTKFAPKYKTVYFTNSMSNGILIITMLLLTALLVQEVLTLFHVHFAYHEVLFAAFFFYFDLTLILCYIKIAKQIRAEKQLVRVQEFHVPDA